MPSQDGRLTVLRTRYKSLSGSGLEYKVSCNNKDELSNCDWIFIDFKISVLKFEKFYP